MGDDNSQMGADLLFGVDRRRYGAPGLADTGNRAFLQPIHRDVRRPERGQLVGLANGFELIAETLVARLRAKGSGTEDGEHRGEGRYSRVHDSTTKLAGAIVGVDGYVDSRDLSV